MADRNANIAIAVQGNASGQLRQMTGDVAALVNQLRAATVAAGQSEAEFLSLAGALSRDALAAGDAARAEQILADANRGLAVTASDATAATTKANQSSQQLGGTFNVVRSAAQQLGIVLGARQIAQMEIDAGRAALALDHTQRVTRAVAGDTATYNAIVAEARTQQRLFGGTLQENIEGLSGLAVTSRNTGASLAQLVDLQKRLTILNPAQGAQGGLIALNEALAGNISSLSRRFNIPRAELQKLSDTSVPVAERLKVIDEFLNKVGITSAAVGQSVSESAQSFNTFNANLDNLKTSLGSELVAEIGPGVELLNRLANTINSTGERSSQAAEAGRNFGRGFAESVPVIGAFLASTHRLNEDLTRLGIGTRETASAGVGLGGVFDEERRATNQFIDAGARLAQIQADGRRESILATQAIQTQADITRQSAQASALDAERKREQAAQIELAQIQANQAADAFLRLHPNIDAAGAASIATAEKIDPLIAQLIQARLRADDATAALQRFTLGTAGAAAFAPPSNALPGTRARGAGGETLSDRFGGGARGVVSDTLQKQRDLQQAQFALELARARTAEQRIAILRREQAATTDQAEKLRIQAQIEGERNSGAKAHTSELGSQLRLQEGIYDSLNKQIDAQISLRKLTAQDTLDRLKENRELAQAQRILASGRASPEFKAAAQARIDLINAERDERAQRIREAQATAGGSIVNGRLLQSQPRAGGVPAVPTPGQAGAPGVPTVPTPGEGGAGVPVVDVRVFLDSQEISARVVTSLRGGLRSANAGGAGRG